MLRVRKHTWLHPCDSLWRKYCNNVSYIINHSHFWDPHIFQPSYLSLACFFKDHFIFYHSLYRIMSRYANSITSTSLMEKFSFQSDQLIFQFIIVFPGLVFVHFIQTCLTWGKLSGVADFFLITQLLDLYYGRYVTL